MIAIAVVIYRTARLPRPLTVPTAAIRGALQLAAVSLILAVALTHLWSSFVVLTVMFVAAATTCAHRTRAGWNAAWLAVALATGVGTVVPLMLISGVVPLDGYAVVPITGIVLGGTMTATTLAARRALDAIDERWGEVEAGLSLGLSTRDARMEVAKSAATDALLPGLDQTRTVGLVTLPGAFVGVLLATGSAAQAGAVQILVLVGLLLAQTCAVTVTLELISRNTVRRAAPA